MKREINIEAILAPIPGDNPAGEDIRYSPVYDQIKEARRADDLLDRGDWQRKIKTSDWNTVIDSAVDALINKSKDLQIAAWLTEALIKTEGFDGLATGLKILTGLLKDYWEHLYPELEDGDLDFRVAPIEFVNDKLWPCIKQVSITDSSATPGYSWLKWQESRQVGFEADTRNRYGDVDENKKKARNELIAEGKLTAEDFDSAVALSSKAFYEFLAESLVMCQEEFKKLDETVDDKFGSEA
ncbi:MAG: type VI secretion system protein TssA, partial [Deltaproteobacteria bacterium]|nr:type VI secretion system protein TssA [Deltaproteobacteria bacterium]